MKKSYSRKNDSTNNKRLLVKFVSFAVCFALVFSLTMLLNFGVFGDLFVSDNLNNTKISEAGWMGTILGDKEAVVSPSSGFSNSTNMNFPGTTDSVLWEYTENIKHADLHGSNGDRKNFTASVWSKNDGSPAVEEIPHDTVINYNSGEFKDYVVATQILRGTGDTNYESNIAFNYQISPFIKQILANPNFKVTAQYKSTVHSKNNAWSASSGLFMNRFVDSNDKVEAANISSDKMTPAGTGATANFTAETVVEREMNYLNIVNGLHTTDNPSTGNMKFIIEKASITYKIEFKADTSSTGNFNDGGIPKFQLNVNEKMTTPFKPDGLVGNGWKSPDNAKDTHRASSINLMSYVNKMQGEAGAEYYKKTSISIIDTFKYDYLQEAQSSVGYDDRMSAGIKNIKIGDSEFDISASANLGKRHDLIVEGFRVGWFFINQGCVDVDGTVVNNNYGNKAYTVDIYFTQNTVVSVAATDLGDLTSTASVVVSGIDTTLPDMLALDVSNRDLTNTIAAPANWDDIIWRHAENVSWSVDPNNDEVTEREGNSGYIWYYDVVNSINGIFESEVTPILPADLLSKKAYASNSISSFKYNFATGHEVGKEPISVQKASDKEAATVKGNGYYRFTFYVADMAGNVPIDVNGNAKYINYYVKADTSLVDHSISYEFGDTKISAGSNVGTLTTNGIWATDELNILIKINSTDDISGFILIFSDLDGRDNTVAVENKGGKFVIVSVNGDDKAPTGPVIIDNGALGTIKVSFTSSNEFKLVYGSDPNILIDVISSFKIQTGIDANHQDLVQSKDPNWQYENDSNIVSDGTVHIKLDREKPEVAVSENEYITDGDILPADKDRIWYTDDWNIDVIATFFDKNMSKYGDEIFVYVATSFDNLSTNIADKYKTIKSLEDAQKYGITYLEKVSVNEFYGDNNSAEISLRLNNPNADRKAGLRGIYVWTVDQAGNVSDTISEHYIMVDANRYRIKATASSSPLQEGDSPAVIPSFTDENGNILIDPILKRGDKITLNFDSTSEYIAYKLNRQNGNQPTTTIADNKTISNILTAQDNNYTSVRQGSTATEILLDMSAYNQNLYDESDGTVHLTYLYRELINYTVTNTNVSYTGEQVVVPISINNLENKNQFFFKFYTDEECKKEFNQDGVKVPTVPGTYYLKMGIATENTGFLASNNTTPIEFKIINKNAVVQVVTQQSYFGDIVDNDSLTFTVDGLNESEVTLVTGSLRIVNTSEANTANLGVGSYIVVQDEAFAIEHYNLTFIAGIHNIVPRNIDINIVDASKDYGDYDPIFSFNVEKTQFKSGHSFGDVFYNVVSNNSVSSLITLSGFDGGQVLQRTAGEDVGEHVFSGSLSLLDYNQNYRINVKNLASANLTINPRQIYINPLENQTLLLNIEGSDIKDNKGDIVGTYIDSVVKLNDEFINTLNYKYSLNQSDLAYKDEIISGLKLTYSPNTVEKPVEGYLYSVYLPADVSSIETSRNVSIAMTQKNKECQFVIIIELGQEVNTINIRIKQGVVFERNYGDGWSEDEIDLSSTDFNITSDVNLADYILSWTTSVETPNSGQPEVGVHQVIVDNITIMSGGIDVSGKYEFIITPFFAEFLPDVVIVTPTSTQNNKIYGESDSIYGISYTLSDSFGNLNSDVSGSFARAIFDSNGNIVRFASRFDIPSDANGNLIDGSGEYYGLAIVSAFEYTISNRYSFSVDTDAMNNIRFVVEKKKITFDPNNLIGTSKNYDGTNVVKYPFGTIAYDISSMKINIDDVRITFAATYDSHEVGERKINFTNIQIVGDDVLKYSFVDNLENAITTDRVFTIDTIDKIEKIKINNVTSFSISKEDIIFQKEYDGNSLVTADDIKISTANILSELDLQLVEGDVFNFQDENVRNNEVFGNFKFFFPMDNPENWTENVDNNDKDITITFVTDGNKGIYVEIKNIVGAILPKQLGVDDFVSIDALDRDYDATVDVEIAYELDVDATVGADRLELKINAKTESKNASTSRVSVSFTSYISNNKNYAVDINSLNSVYGGINSLNILISKKQVKIDAIFNPNKIYNGQAVLTRRNTVGGDSYSNNQIVPYLLSKTEVNDELKAIKFNWNDVGLYLSSYNDENEAINDPNVVFDKNGNVVKHDVRIDGLIISVDPTVDTTVDIGELFSNYYIDNAKIPMIQNNQIIFDSFVMESVATLNRKSVGLAPGTDVKVYDKIYDKNRDAKVSAQIDNTEIVEFMGKTPEIGLSLYGEFADENVGDNIQVNIYSNGIVDLIDDQNMAKNYILSGDIPTSLKAEIKPKPITFTTDSGEKVYDNNDNIDINHITTTEVKGVFDNEKYVIEFVAGRYEDENSSWNTDTEVYERKKSSLYGAKLINQYQRDMINYQLTEKGAFDVLRVLYAVQLTTGEFVIASISGDKVLDIYGQAILKTDIAGYYYNLKDEEIDLGNGDVSTMSVVASTGIVKRANLVLGIEILTNKTTKDYDASTKYLGKYGTDFKIVDSYGNDLKYPDLTEVVFDSKYVTAEYDDANSGVRTIVFNIDTKGLPDNFYNSLNYESASNSWMRAQGLIKKISIDSLLSKTTVKYGFNEISLENSLTYSSTFGGQNKVDLVKALLNGQVKLFVEQSQYKASFPSDTEYADDTKFVIIDGIAVEIPANNESTVYVPLKGLFELPVADSTSNQYTPAGEATLKMKVVEQARTTNFTYNLSYDLDGNLDGTESKLIIEKTDLFVFASQIVYTQVYGESAPNVVIDFYGNKNGDIVSQIFGDKKMPTAVFKFFDGLVWSEMSSTSKILSEVDIQAGKFYGAFVVIDPSVLLDNYNLELRYDATDVEDVDNIPKLSIVLPTISDVELSDKTVIYNASEQHLAIISGVMVGDIVTYELKVDNDWRPFVDDKFPTDVRFDKDGKVIGYEIRVNVQRAIADDANKYFYQDYEGSAVLTIKKARLGISADDVDVKFDFETKEFNKDNIEFEFVGDDLKDLVVVELEMKKDNDFVECTEILRAGSYRINIEYSPTGNSNFESEQAESYYDVKPITFNVTVTQSDLKQEYVSGNMPIIKYKSELIEEFSSIDPSKIPTTKIVLMSELVSSGIYRYEVVVYGVEHPTDYAFIGENNGSIMLGKSTVINGNNSSVSLPSGDIIIADSFSWSELNKDNQTVSDSYYWNIVNSHIAGIAEEKNDNVDLMSIVQIALINNGAKIQPNEEVIVKVKVPDSAKDIDNLIVYAVTESGQLKSVDYNIVDGYIVYKTDFIEALVFVEIGALQTLEIVAIALGVTVIVVGMLAGIFIGLKIKNKKKCS